MGRGQVGERQEVGTKGGMLGAGSRAGPPPHWQLSDYRELRQVLQPGIQQGQEERRPSPTPHIGTWVSTALEWQKQP